MLDTLLAIVKHGSVYLDNCTRAALRCLSKDLLITLRDFTYPRPTPDQQKLIDAAIVRPDAEYLCRPGEAILIAAYVGAHFFQLHPGVYLTTNFLGPIDFETALARVVHLYPNALALPLRKRLFSRPESVIVTLELGLGERTRFVEYRNGYQMFDRFQYEAPFDVRLIQLDPSPESTVSELLDIAARARQLGTLTPIYCCLPEKRAAQRLTQLADILEKSLGVLAKLNTLVKYEFHRTHHNSGWHGDTLVIYDDASTLFSRGIDNVVERMFYNRSRFNTFGKRGSVIIASRDSMHLLDVHRHIVTSTGLYCQASHYHSYETADSRPRFAKEFLKNTELNRVVSRLAINHFIKFSVDSTHHRLYGLYPEFVAPGDEPGSNPAYSFTLAALPTEEQPMTVWIANRDSIWTLYAQFNGKRGVVSTSSQFVTTQLEPGRPPRRILLEFVMAFYQHTGNLWQDYRCGQFKLLPDRRRPVDIPDPEAANKRDRSPSRKHKS